MRRSTFMMLVAALPATLAAQEPIRGFPTAMVQREVQDETVARAVPSADTLRQQLLILSETPHDAGTERSHHVAELILARFRSYGLDAKIEEFQALMPRPISRTLELVAPDTFTATLKEPAIPEDKDSGDSAQIPTFNAYSPDGDVTAPLVYVNYGTPEDYKVLDSLGISVKGKIVIARYGRSWRGIKEKVAAQHGALGCIIYSDPRDDGYFVDDVYPTGPMRPWEGVQRGSIMDMPTYPGDPLSPGFASTPGAKVLPDSAAKNLPTIPTLPISYGDALPFLRHLTGPVAPESWRGALPITYHIGPGGSVAHLALKFDWKSRPLYDVIARVPGARSGDQWILYGNHHDAWVNGAEDPLSGQVALDETARAVGALLKTGWRPDRTLIFAAWDGEEWGLLGSTEWAEDHQAELRQKLVAYLNSDTNNRGWLRVAGSHALEVFFEQVARDIRDPKTGKSVLDAALAHDKDSVFTIGALGSGSDYTAFLDFLGVASANAAYGGATHSGIYHSIYDSYDFYTRFLDTNFVYGVAESQTTATALLRLADAPVLPFDFTHPARRYKAYADEIAKEAAKNPKLEGLDLSRLMAALDRLERAAAHFDTVYAGVDSLSAERVQRRWGDLERANETIYQTERALTSDAGLPHRPWFHHLIYAPGYYTGYGVKTMPGLREAVEDVPDLATAQREGMRVARAIDRYADQINLASAELQRALR
ncbi:MAG TPA: transferrin receptor-like dimerization domain-containing protein [Gemmatimonadales bacterium]|nr:transferrin receptor-like dimerization domain-containing protein [Gemmatimonadales bacterium]